MPLTRLVATLAFGVIAFFGWSFGFQAGYNFAWSLAYAPDVPSRSWHYSVLVILCSALGVAFGAVVPLFAKSHPGRAVGAFFVGLVLACCFVAFAYADGFATLAAHAQNVGTYSFVLAIGVGAFVAARGRSSAV